MSEYLVEEIPCSTLQVQLNKYAKDGWEFVILFKDEGAARVTVILKREGRVNESSGK